MKITLKEIIKATNGKCLNSTFNDQTNIEAFTTDSRKCTAGALFIPLKGEKFDGHDFIPKLYDQGATATLTMEERLVDSRLCTIYVQDTKKALLDLAHYYRMQFKIPVVGVTGSVGKTSTKEMIAATLSGKFKVHKTQGNYNNEIGVPLTLFALDEGDEAAVIEMGMNHFGEIHKLSLAASPQIAVITNIGTSHIENLGSREGILKAKLEILDGLDEKGLLVVNGDNDFLGKLHNLKVPIKTFGLSSKNDYWAEDIKCEDQYTYAKVTTPNAHYRIQIEALGEHMVYNALAAIAVGEAYGLTTEEIQRGLKLYKPTKMRMQITQTAEGIIIMDDTYNASLDSMKAALKVLENYTCQGRKIAVLGDMLEMGDFSQQLHRAVGAYAGQSKIDKIYAVGDLAQFIAEGAAKEKQPPQIAYISTKEETIELLNKELKAGDTVLFKASRGMHFEQLVEAVRKVK